MSGRHLRQFRAGGRRAGHTIFPQTIERVGNLGRRICRCAMTEFEMAEWQSKRGGNRIIAPSGVRYLVPADRGQTNIRAVQVGQERAVSAGVPAEKIEKTSNRFGARGIRCGRRTRGRPRPGSRMSLIETKLAAHFFINLQLPKVGRRLRPLHVPASSCDKIALMHTIPKMSAELDRYDPAKRENKVGSRELKGNSMFDV